MQPSCVEGDPNVRGSSQSTRASLCVFSEVGFLRGAASACSQSCSVRLRLLPWRQWLQPLKSHWLGQ